MKTTNNVVDYTAILAQAKALNAKVQSAKDHAVEVEMAHKNAKTCAAAAEAFYALKKEYDLWKKNNIEKRGLMLKTIGDLDEPVGIFMVLAGAWSRPLKLSNGRFVVAD